MKPARPHISAHVTITADGKIAAETDGHSSLTFSEFRSLAEADLVDEIFLTIVPVVFGGADSPTLTGMPGSFLPSAFNFKILDHRSEGGKCFLHLRRKNRR